ncbi:MAG TPA: HEAT repeat domain-containing protein [Phycisphaerae bacterium]|nr:HEAT repeat domain-containing protein [Phycisphaerae bacterium]
MKARILIGVSLLLAGGAAGCAGPGGSNEPAVIRQRAMECLKRGAQYEYLASVRAAAIEALGNHGGPETLPWIRNALHDDSEGVRFSAEMALGARKDELALPALRKLHAEGTPSDRIGAIYAMHQMGDTRFTGELAGHLLDGATRTERGNAALVLGRLGGEGTNRLLSLALSDTNPAMRVNVLEAMALQHNEYAIETLHANAYGGIGAEEVFALNTLATLRDPKYANLFRLRMEEALHIESKLAAARGLGLLGDKSGYELAVGALTYRATQPDKTESAANQTHRVHQMAAHALAAIGDPRALPGLRRLMDDAEDPRTQIAAANAILTILEGNRAAPEAGNRAAPAMGPAEGVRR